MRVIVYLYARVYIEHFVNFVKTNLLGCWVVILSSKEVSKVGEMTVARSHTGWFYSEGIHFCGFTHWWRQRSWDSNTSPKLPLKTAFTGDQASVIRLLGRRLLHRREGVEIAAENSHLHYIHSWEGGSNGSWYSTHFLLPSAREHSPWMVPPTFRMGFLSSVKPFWKHPYRHPYKYVSMVILNPV